MKNTYVSKHEFLNTLKRRQLMALLDASSQLVESEKSATFVRDALLDLLPELTTADSDEKCRLMKINDESEALRSTFRSIRDDCERLSDSAKGEQ